jgi:HK97 family phage major capsid protein
MKALDYSLTRLITALATGDKAVIENCPEVRFSRETLEPELGRPARFGGAILPSGFRPQASGLSGNLNSSGNYAEQTTVADQIAQAVRAQSHVLALGAQLVPGGVGKIQFPVAESGTQTHWIAEAFGIDPATTDPVFSARTVFPHSMVTSCQYSRQLLTQARADLDLYVIADLGRAIAAEVDRVAILGSGMQEPLGLLNTAAVPVVALGTNGANPVADNLAQMEETVGLANLTPTGWLTTPSIRRRLRKTTSITSTYASAPLWSDDAGGAVMAYPARTSTNVPSTLTKGTSTNCHAIIHGDWTQLIVTTWNHEILVDPFQNKKQGMITTTVYTELDLVVLRPAGFVFCVDALA